MCRGGQEGGAGCPRNDLLGWGERQGGGRQLYQHSSKETGRGWGECTSRGGCRSAAMWTRQLVRRWVSSKPATGRVESGAWNATEPRREATEHGAGRNSRKEHSEAREKQQKMAHRPAANAGSQQRMWPGHRLAIVGYLANRSYGAVAGGEAPCCPVCPSSGRCTICSPCGVCWSAKPMPPAAAAICCAISAGGSSTTCWPGVPDRSAPLLPGCPAAWPAEGTAATGRAPEQ